MTFITESLNSTHKKNDFSCGQELLDNYLRYQANQDIKRKLSACFILAEKDEVKGYYTLSNGSIPLSQVPDHLRKKLPPSYLTIPVTLLGRLAIDLRFKGLGLGSLLLMDALKRSYVVSDEVGSYAVVVDPLNEEAEKFYLKFGFTLLPDSQKLFLPMNIIKQLF
jgi:GNAT superfamily N-acetyltransferase